MQSLILWPALIAGISTSLLAQDESVAQGALRPQGTEEAPGAVPAVTNSPFANLVTPIHTAPDDVDGGPYGIWATGQDYKVSFHGAPTFIPFLGAEYPHNQPLTWNLESVTAGNAELLTGVAAQRSHTTTRYEYRYGTVTEVYDVRSEGLEQSFVISQRPATPGDLVVSMRFDAPGMEPASTFVDEHRAVSFVDMHGTELVRYGEAFVFDASGEKHAIGTTLVGNTIRLTVPATFMASAQFPLTVDPLTTPIRINGGAEILTTDVVRNDRSDNVLYTYTRMVSATDADCWAWNGPDGLAAAGTIVFTDNNVWSTAETSCACIGTSAVNRYIIAIARNLGTSTGVRLWSQNASAPFLDTSVIGPGTGGNHNWNVDCGGIEAFNQSGSPAGGAEAVVVFQRDFTGSSTQNSSSSGIYALIITGSGTGITFTPQFVVAADATRDQEFPSVTKVSEGTTRGPLASWLCAYQEYDLTIARDDWDAYASRIFSDSTVVGGRWFPSVAAGAHKIDVQIEGQRGRYLVTYGRVDQALLSKVSGLRSNQIVNERFDWPVGGAITRFPEVNTSGSLGRIFRTSDIAFDADSDSLWATTWSSPGGTGSLFFERVGYTGNRLEVVSIFPSGGALTRSGICFNDDANNFISIYGQADGRLFSLEHDFFDEPNAPSVTGTSCSAASPSWVLKDSFDVTVSNTNGDQQIGLEFGTARVTGMPAGALSVMGVSLATSNINIGGIPGVGFGCRDLIATSGPGFLGFLDLRIGTTGEWQLPLPEFVAPMTIYFQAFHLNGAGNRFLSTERLEVPIY